MIDEEGRNCTVVADGRSDAAVPLCSECASDAHLTAVNDCNNSMHWALSVSSCQASRGYPSSQM